ncbi:hypothetical protein CHL67_00190 [Prosthecochloris sp. GSB1]|uniref:hypothetical protein n=1 Tax=Prosthecochloris sp. GSB1 TaxID=281093 RepID=UPI000B8CC11E|nr:hypothetical protein [Prosthecochloris sp. GSB1]ASQ89566.1 hypothetical protein CHL67_00190 [Prosthecochloris sp. GSB1]
MSTTWERVIAERRHDILRRWQEKGLGLFAEKMSPATPMGEAMADAMEMILDGFATGDDLPREGISRLARILAVQSFRPSRSLSVFTALRDVLLASAPDRDAAEVCRKRIEAMTFEAFDSFMEHREKIYQLKVEESRDRMYMQLRRSVS